MRILITNDDGISAPGLAVAEAIAAELAGPEGDVWVVAPAFEQSGVGHCVSYIRPMRIEPLEERRFAVEGSPADCVLAGIGEILRDHPPDLIISGVNRGHNIAEDTLYSGTVGGAMEGALHGLPSVALSQYFTTTSFFKRGGSEMVPAGPPFPPPPLGNLPQTTS
ncbi:5'/3'-nucleotidase SurE, partial [Amaricoccus sp. HAR-UPW-R2A-40]